MNTETDITAITVCWNTKELIERAYNSIRNFHPTMKMLVIDGSDSNSHCYQFLDSLVLNEKDNALTVIHMSRNIGHGRGMDFGIRKVHTPYVLFFDSDVVMVKSPVQAMLDMMEDNTFGVGYCESVGMDGHDYGIQPHHKNQPSVKYMHPYFQLVQVKEYFKYKPYFHHGAPCIQTMINIYKKGLSDIVLKEFPGLGHTGTRQGVSWKTCAGEYILHDVSGFGGTGRMRVQSGLPHIEGEWDRIVT